MDNIDPWRTEKTQAGHELFGKLPHQVQRYPFELGHGKHVIQGLRKALEDNTFVAAPFEAVDVFNASAIAKARMFAQAIQDIALTFSLLWWNKG